MATSAPADYVRQLEATTRDAARWLSELPEPVITWKPSPTAWCIKEIIGHLVDSAANNHQRFVRAGDQDHLVFPGYEQNQWVRVQAYDRAPWDELVTLWATYNLHEIGWRSFPADQPATLDDLMHDYVLHLEHHLTQVRDRIRGAEASGRAE